MPKADATELAPKKSAISPPMFLIEHGRACLFERDKQKSLPFFGEAPERRPWAIKREDRPAAFAGRSFCIFRLGYFVRLHRRVSYPTPAPTPYGTAAAQCA